MLYFICGFQTIFFAKLKFILKIKILFIFDLFSYTFKRNAKRNININCFVLFLVSQRTKDPIAIELYAKKVSSVPTGSEMLTETAAGNVSTLPTLQPSVERTEADKVKTYRDVLHSHETGAHAKTNEASNWYEPAYGVKRMRKGSEYNVAENNKFFGKLMVTLLNWIFLTIQRLQFSAIKCASFSAF